jgi:catechol 2,3-dioxygenase-like lactoylglutathione lyase family enzyme
MEARIHVITLGVDDLERALVFYRDGLGLATAGVIGTEFAGDDENAAGAVVMFQLSGDLILALYPRAELGKDANVSVGADTTGGSALDTRYRAERTSMRSWNAPSRWVRRRPVPRTIVLGGSIPDTFAIPTVTCGRSCGIRSSPSRLPPYRRRGNWHGLVPDQRADGAQRRHPLSPVIDDERTRQVKAKSSGEGLTP